MTARLHMLAVEHVDLMDGFYVAAVVFVALFLFMYRMYRHTEELRREVERLRAQYDADSAPSGLDVGTPLNS